MAWCYPDESNDYAYQVLDALADARAIVPSLWALELANALLVGQRRCRLTDVEIARFLGLVRALPIEIDAQTAAHGLSDTFQLARAHGLSAYDAAYLEVAIREGVRLATLDDKLRRAAAAAGVALVGRG